MYYFWLWLGRRRRPKLSGRRGFARTEARDFHGRASGASLTSRFSMRRVPRRANIVWSIRPSGRLYVVGLRGVLSVGERDATNPRNGLSLLRWFRLGGVRARLSSGVSVWMKHVHRRADPFWGPSEKLLERKTPCISAGASAGECHAFNSGGTASSWVLLAARAGNRGRLLWSSLPRNLVSTVDTVRFPSAPSLIHDGLGSTSNDKISSLYLPPDMYR